MTKDELIEYSVFLTVLFLLLGFFIIRGGGIWVCNWDKGKVVDVSIDRGVISPSARDVLTDTGFTERTWHAVFVGQQYISRRGMYSKGYCEAAGGFIT